GAILSATRLSVLGRRLMVASILFLAACGYSPFGSLLLYPLEERFPPWDASRGAPDGIIVLGGAVGTDATDVHGDASVTNSAGRIVAAATLAHRYPKARILYSGGNANVLMDTALREADYATALFEGLGISRDRLILERDSRNTYENAVYSKALAAPKPG